ncbi:MAG: coenzyme F420-0:L-glutamate ligase [Methanotrichaceae archaeon]|nr:coenzyme F420-0:L-glutamate ligase [Methanotrichaceae archaeon]
MPTLIGNLIRGLPRIEEGDSLAPMIESCTDLQDGDVLCVASTIVAKSEGRFRNLDLYRPSEKAAAIAERLGKDPRFVQAVLDESEEVLITDPFLLVATRFGHICVNAGIDQSNVGRGEILLLPEDPERSAERLRSDLSTDCAVIITDTCGRPFRCGVAGLAIGWAGIAALRDWRGEVDLFGKALEITLESIVDEIAGIANMMMGEGGDGTPAVVLRGLSYPRSGGRIFMPVEKDVIRRQLR